MPNLVARVVLQKRWRRRQRRAFSLPHQNEPLDPDARRAEHEVEKQRHDDELHQVVRVLVADAAHARDAVTVDGRQ